MIHFNAAVVLLHVQSPLATMPQFYIQGVPLKTLSPFAALLPGYSCSV